MVPIIWSRDRRRAQPNVRSALRPEVWLKRIGHAGRLTPTHETLNGQIFAHAQAISCETLDIMLGRRPKLSRASDQDHRAQARPILFRAEHVVPRGAPQPLLSDHKSARPRGLRIAIDVPRPAIHKLLQVQLSEGSYLADLGFGNLAATCALLVKLLIEQETPHELMGFIDIGGELRLQARFRHDRQHIYRVIPSPRYDGEYEITNWYTGTHPETPYQGNIIVLRGLGQTARGSRCTARVTVRDGRRTRRQAAACEGQRIRR